MANTAAHKNVKLKKLQQSLSNVKITCSKIKSVRIKAMDQKESFNL